MNYPIWDQPGSGLLIAAIAIVHVFVSHFAVGGGLFLVVTERRARRTHDHDLLAYVRRHSRFFVLLTLVFGALTGVGIWFVIGLVHPSATSMLIQLFVWFWAIEWTFFIVEIVAALVYHYGWDRLTPVTHMRIGWVYAVASWMSLVVINGILTFMLTPGAWLETRSVWDAFVNPTYWPALVARSAAAAGLAGLYALLTASWMTRGALKPRLARYAGAGWVLPMAVVLPLSLAWYVWAAAGAGIDVRGIFGAPEGSLVDAFRTLWTGGATGHPVARMAVGASLAGGVGLVVLLVFGVLRRPARFGPLTVAPMLLCGIVAFGGVEFVREDLRKPYVLSHVMFVNGVRLAPAWDPYSIAQIEAKGLLASSKYVHSRAASLPADDLVGRLAADGQAISTVLCASCHTIDGYLALRPLVAGRSVGALETTLAKLAVPLDAAGQPTSWSQPHVGLSTWRGRYMPPFVGTVEERHALAVYLARLGGATDAQLAAATTADDPGRAYFDDNCAMCHGDGGEWPLAARPPQPVAAYYDMLGRLPAINEVMPPFEGDESLRRALAVHLSALGASQPPGGAR